MYDADGHRETEPWFDALAANLYWLGAEAVSHEERPAGVHEFIATFPGNPPLIRRLARRDGPDQQRPEDMAGWFYDIVVGSIEDGDIRVEHDWGMILTYRLSEADLKRIQISRERGRPTNTPVVLGTSKVADWAGPACLRCGVSYPDDRCRGHKAAT